MIIVGTKSGTVLGINLVSQSVPDVWKELETSNTAIRLVGKNGLQVGIIDGALLEYVINVDEADIELGMFQTLSADLRAYS